MKYIEFPMLPLDLEKIINEYTIDKSNYDEVINQFNRMFAEANKFEGFEYYRYFFDCDMCNKSTYLSTYLNKEIHKNYKKNKKYKLHITYEKLDEMFDETGNEPFSICYKCSEGNIKLSDFYLKF